MALDSKKTTDEKFKSVNRNYLPCLAAIYTSVSYSDTESVGEVSGERGKQESSLELQQTTAPCSETTELNGQYSLVEAEPQQTTEPNTPLYSVVQKRPKQTKEPPLPAEPQQTTEPNTQLYSVVQKRPKQAKEPPLPAEPQQTTEPNTQLYSVVQKKPKQGKEPPLPAEPQQTTEPNTQLYSVVQKKPKQAKELPVHTDPQQSPDPNAQYAVVQKKPKQTKVLPVEPHGTTELNDQYSAVQEAVNMWGKDLDTRKQTLVYAEVGPHISQTRRQMFNPQSDRVQYASLDHTATVRAVPPAAAEPLQDPDLEVSLDQILIQLREVTPHWRRLGEAVGVHRLDEISEYVGSESEAMVEVVDGWLANLHPNKPTWREIADVVDSIGHHDLAHSLRQVYISGSLPIKVSNDLPESLVVREFNPTPPLPPRGADDEQLPSPLPARTLI
ncbi:hypothetical protein GBAR_LOCUS25782 [Geodia barretti]|uniref:Death domain-containing protein n=1 Tax=Geodia barretti TaxID=519541 RepID=A0AA35TEN7_GEOBA|nr:hypothetical protein GBAR_LOCUS25782 [Geodia barretti]